MSVSAILFLFGLQKKRYSVLQYVIIIIIEAFKA